MTDQDRYTAGVPCWLDLTPPDPAHAAAFYGALFGWEIEDVMPSGSSGRYLIGRLGGRDVAAIGTPHGGARPAAAWTTYVWVDDADEAARRVVLVGGRVLISPQDVGDAGRMALCADPEGATFGVWQAGRHRGSGVVNEHGSVNFNVLRARDAERARAFYGAVFGWQVLDLDGGDARMWTLPDYGLFLERRIPGRYHGMAAMGAPDPFADVVASFVPAGDERPHWGVTFAVDDADAIAARAAALGGRVLTAPFDLPWIRAAVLADPQGARFTVSRFAPENKDVPRAVGATTG